MFSLCCIERIMLFKLTIYYFCFCICLFMALCKWLCIPLTTLLIAIFYSFIKSLSSQFVRFWLLFVFAFLLTLFLFIEYLYVDWVWDVELLLFLILGSFPNTRLEWDWQLGIWILGLLFYFKYWLLLFTKVFLWSGDLALIFTLFILAYLNALYFQIISNDQRLTNI